MRGPDWADACGRHRILTRLTGACLAARLAVTLVAAVTAPLAAQPVVATQALVPLGTTVVRESGDILLNKPSALAVGARGRLFIGDFAEGRVLQIAPNGTIEHVFGRKGRGPGELESPGAIALSGDTLLAVFDNGSRRVSYFTIATGKFSRSVLVSVMRPAMEFRGTELLFSSFDTQRKSSVVSLTSAGTTGVEGILPPIVERLPMLASAFPNAAFATHGDDLFAAFEVSAAIFQWKRGTTKGTATELPKLRRLGVDEGLYEQMVRDPANARGIAFLHSVPMAARFLGASTLALATVDATQAGMSFTGIYYLSLVDLEKRTACLDVQVPIPRDPMPHVAFRGDTLFAIVQDAKSADQSATIHRFRIDPRRCAWLPLPAAKRAGN